MLARVAADFYWLGRYVERTEHTGRLLQYQLTRLVDRPADELAIGWQAVYRALGQFPPGVSADPDEAETYLMVDAYTLAGSLVEEGSNPASMLSCWERARENARHVRPQLPLPVWTCLNQGYLWMRDSNFAGAWSKAPAALVREAIDRLRLFACVVDAVMYQDDAWRFLELGRFVERTQAQAALLGAWVEIGRGDRAASTLSWADLLRVCGAYEVYCRNRWRFNGKRCSIFSSGILDFPDRFASRSSGLTRCSPVSTRWAPVPLSRRPIEWRCTWQRPSRLKRPRPPAKGIRSTFFARLETTVGRSTLSRWPPMSTIR